MNIHSETLYFVFVFINTVTSQSCIRCSPSHCGEDERSSNEPISTLKGDSFSGIPGKKGPAGAKGEKGTKGEPGAPEEIEDDVIYLKNKISHLEEKLLLAEEKCEDWIEWKEKLLAPKTCADISPKVDGIYTIRPSPLLQSFQVNCLFRDGAEITVFSHDSESEIQAAPECEEKLCYRRNVTYRANFDQIKAVMKLSHTCRQYIKWRCQASQLFRKGANFGGFMSADNIIHHYWGGSSEESNGCACGTTASCVDNQWKCNCDQNGGSYVDEGYLTYHPHLPVWAVFFGDLGDANEHGYHTIGALECF